MAEQERPPVEPEDCGERHHDKDGFPLPCHVCGRNGGTVVAGRPPVDPLREDIRFVAEFYHEKFHPAYPSIDVCENPRCINLRAALASPAAPRPEGLDAVDSLLAAITERKRYLGWMNTAEMLRVINEYRARLSATSEET